MGTRSHTSDTPTRPRSRRSIWLWLLGAAFTFLLVSCIPPSNTSPPVITGTAQVGETLTSSTGVWAQGPRSFAYRWQRCDPETGNCADIDGATQSTYTVAATDFGQQLRVRVTATNGSGSASANSAKTAAVTPEPPAHPLEPTRLYDGMLGPGETVEIQIMGVDEVPSEGIAAVVLRLEAFDPTEASSLTVWRADAAKPEVPSLSFAAGESSGNSVAVGLSPDGKVLLFNEAGTVRVTVDAAAWFAEESVGSLTTIDPFHLTDSLAIGPGETKNVRVIGIGGIPDEGVAAVTANVTVAGATAPSSLTVWPAGASQPEDATVSYVAAQTRQITVLVGVGDGGEVSLRNETGTVLVSLDVTGWFGIDDVESGGLTLTPPTEVLSDSLATGETRDIQVTGVGNVPSSGVEAVALQVHATALSDATSLSVWPAGSTRPSVPALEVPAGGRADGLLFVAVGDGGSVSVFNSEADVAVSVEVVAWFGDGGVLPPDNSPPELEVVSPTSGATVDATAYGTFEMTGWVEDAGSGVDQVLVSAGGLVEAVELDRTSAPIRWRIELSAPSSGAHTFEVAALDRAGASTSRSVTLDVLMPPPEATVPAPGLRKLGSTAPFVGG